MLKLENRTITIKENDTLVKNAMIKDKIFYLWFDHECGDKNKTYGNDIIYKDDEIIIKFEAFLEQGMTRIKTEVIQKNRFYNVSRVTSPMNIDKLDDMPLYEIIKEINNHLKLM